MVESSSRTAALSGTSSHIVLIEDDMLLRQLLAQAIQQRFQPKTLKEFGDGRSGLAHCLEYPPDLLVTDLRLPGGLDGLEIVRRLRAATTHTRYLVLTSNSNPSLPAELLALGVAGFVDKSSPLKHAELAIERVLAGGLYFSASITPAVPSHHKLTQPGDLRPPSTLTDREREIARLVAEGLYSKEIGERLGLSARTVEKERVLLMEKIGVRDLPGLIRWCVKNGLA